MEYTFLAFDTDCIIHIHEEHDASQIQALCDEIQSWHAIFNVFDPKSEVSRFNTASDVFVAVPLFYEVTKQMMLYREKSQTYFEPFVEVLLAAFRQQKGIETDVKDGYMRLHHTGNIEFQKGYTLKKSSPDLQINFHSFLKGYACDYMREAMYETLDLRNFFIDFGGNLIAEGMQDDGTYWHAGIQNPQAGRGEISHVIPLVNASLVTSASYERPFMVEGQLRSHIIDPETGEFLEFKTRSVTIESEHSVIAEVLSTVLSVCPKEKGKELLKQFSAKAYLIEDESMEIL